MIRPPKDPSTTGPGLYAKLITAAASVSGVDKNGDNSQQHYKYAKAEDVIAAASKALTDAELAVLPTMGTVETVREYETRSGSYGVTVRVEMLYTVVDPESGESTERRYLGTGSDSPGDKAIYKAVTGAAKYFYAGLLGIGFGADPEEDRGGEGAEPVAAASAPQVARLRPERVDAIIEAFKEQRLSGKDMNELLAAAGAQALRGFTAEAVIAHIASLGEVEADALEAATERRANGDPDAPRLPDETLDRLTQGYEIAGPELGGNSRLDGLNILLGSLGYDGYDLTDDFDVREVMAKWSPEQADAVLAAFEEAVDKAAVDEEEVDGEIVADGATGGEAEHVDA